MTNPNLDTKINDWLDVKNKYDQFALGVEIEAEGRKLPYVGEPMPVSSYWRSMHEGSLRAGQEYVFRQPLALAHCKKAFDEWDGMVAAYKTVFFDSIRTSTHVHINVLSLTFKQLFSVISAFYIVENALVHMHGKRREGNLFCLRLSDAEGTLNIMMHELKSDRLFASSTSNEYRYAALNLAAIRKFGSIEFRFLKGIYEGHELLKWCTALQDLVKSAAQIGDIDKILSLSHSLSPRAFLELFFYPTFTAEILEANPNIAEIIKLNQGLLKKLSVATKFKVKKPFRLSIHEDMPYARSLVKPSAKPSLNPWADNDWPDLDEAGQVGQWNQHLLQRRQPVRFPLHELAVPNEPGERIVEVPVPPAQRADQFLAEFRRFQDQVLADDDPAAFPVINEIDIDDDPIR